jgi:hypothetical protein
LRECRSVSMRGVASRLFQGRGRKEPRVSLGVFGKHPGWNDHIDDLGLETAFLVDLKRTLYVEGIGRNIDSGHWQRLATENRLPAFGHVFVFRVGADIAAGRMWPSRDGRGRSAYPMIACVHVHGGGEDWVFTDALPALEHIERECRQTESAEKVAALVDEQRRRLAATSPNERSDGAPGSLASLARHSDMGPEGLGMIRVLFELERECAGWIPGGLAGSTTRLKGSPSAHHLRVPACGADSQSRLGAWIGAMSEVIAPAAPLFLISPLGRPWVDIIVGPPGPEQLFCILAEERQIPLTTQIPYAVDAEFEARARVRLFGQGLGG